VSSHVACCILLCLGVVRGGSQDNWAVLGIGDVLEALDPRRIVAAVACQCNSGSGCRTVCPGLSYSCGGFSISRIINWGGLGIVRATRAHGMGSFAGGSQSRLLWRGWLG
jgi:hypothetical protein